MAKTEDLTATDRIRNAKQAVTGARKALERAEAGLRAAEGVAETAAKATSHPVLFSLGVIATAGMLALVIALVRSQES